MQKIKALFFFYRGMVLTTLVLAGMLGGIAQFTSGMFFQICGISIVMAMPLIHFFKYELQQQKDYFFYYNLGLGKPLLWVLTVLGSGFTGIIVMFL